jgi:molecular chaperone DnaK
LSQGDIDKMVKDAAAHEAEDKRRREEIERRNKLDNLCYTLDKQLSENKDKLEGSELSSLESLIKEGREAVEKQDDQKVQDVFARLEKQAHDLASKLYASAGGGGNGAPGPSAESTDSSGNGKSKGDVIDAEFEETR